MPSSSEGLILFLTPLVAIRVEFRQNEPLIASSAIDLFVRHTWLLSPRCSSWRGSWVRAFCSKFFCFFTCLLACFWIRFLLSVLWSLLPEFFDFFDFSEFYVSSFFLRVLSFLFPDLFSFILSDLFYMYLLSTEPVSTPIYRPIFWRAWPSGL